MLLAQISDSHVTLPDAVTDYGGDTGPGLSRCVEELARMRPSPQAVIASGDLVNEGTVQEYARFKHLLAGLTMPVFVIPGNHDRRDALRAALRDHRYLPQSGPVCYAVEDWDMRLIALDTVLEGEEGGALDTGQLEWLDATLSADRARPTMIVMHHPPFRTGIGRMDEIALDSGSAARLGDIVERHPQIERIACGHVHRAAQVRWRGTLVSLCPSTAFQARVNLGPEGEFAPTGEPPGYQMHYWNGEQLVTYSIFVS